MDRRDSLCKESYDYEQPQTVFCHPAKTTKLPSFACAYFNLQQYSVFRYLRDYMITPLFSY